MMLRTVVRDCLFLNWALPAEALPEPPAPLRYQLHSWQGTDYVFASALLFHQDALHLTALPLLRVGYPQLNLRLYVLDEKGIPSVLFRRMLMPAWVAPGVRLVTHQPAGWARLDFPRPSQRKEPGPWDWRVERGGKLAVRAWQSSPTIGEGPRVGDWERTVRYFQERPFGYAESAGALHRIEVRHDPAAVWPLQAEIQGAGLLPRLFCLDDGDASAVVEGSGGAASNGDAGNAGNAGNANWPPLHSTWLCPEIPFIFDLGIAQRLPVQAPVPQPIAGRVASPVWRADALGVSGPGREGRRAAAGVVLASAA